MKKIYDIDQILTQTKFQTGMALQINADEDIAEELTKYLCEVAEIIDPQELTGMAREATDKSAEEIIELIENDNTTATGIKVHRYPTMSLHKYERWEGGYIEGFLRVSTLGPDYFIWTFIRMDKLEGILRKFEDKMYYFGE